MNFSQVTTGYNSVQVRRYAGAPMHQNFTGVPPFVQPQRWVIRQIGMSAFTADVTFDSTTLAQYALRDQAVVYSRNMEGNGVFVPLATIYDPVEEKSHCNCDEVRRVHHRCSGGRDAPALPVLALPAAGARVDQTRPVALRWIPAGRVTGSHLQIATDSLVHGSRAERLHAQEFVRLRGVVPLRRRRTSGESVCGTKWRHSLDLPFILHALGSVRECRESAGAAATGTRAQRSSSDGSPMPDRMLIFICSGGMRLSAVWQTALSIPDGTSGKCRQAGWSFDTTYAVRVQVHEDTTLFGLSGVFKYFHRSGLPEDEQRRRRDSL